MSPPTVRVNTFVNENEKPHVDPISKIFIISELIFGLGRMPLLGKGKLTYVLLTFMIFVIWNFVLIYMTVLASDMISIDIMVTATIAQNVITTLLSFSRSKLMHSFYSELNKFDAQVGCWPKVSFSCIRNIVQASLTCVLVLMLFVTPVAIDVVKYSPTQFIPVYFVYVLEVHYIGHLLNLLTPRLKWINYCMESSLSTAKSESEKNLKEFVWIQNDHGKIAQCSMKKLMDLYQIVVEAYDFLIEGIKWQLLTIIVMAFVDILGCLYQFSLHAIRVGAVVTSEVILHLGLMVILMAPLFAPCAFSDSVHNEVKKLRELLASRLYENQLDKSGRRVARALLAFTETRDLSFRLLRMLNIDISLPFKFVGLLITYLIILLQFEKVLNP